jgi:hypothetical protein
MHQIGSNVVHVPQQKLFEKDSSVSKRFLILDLGENGTMTERRARKYQRPAGRGSPSPAASFEIYGFAFNLKLYAAKDVYHDK